jgi:hypothetical protein
MVQSVWEITNDFFEFFPRNQGKVLILHSKDLAVNCRQRKGMVGCSHDAVDVTEYGRSNI